jgi:hypothetical protein
MVRRIGTFGVLLGIFSLPLYGATATAAVVSSSEAAQTIVINDLTVRGDSVSGTVVNKSAATLREIELLVRQTWLWEPERHSGTDDPGRTLPFMLGVDVAPNTTAPFSFHTPPLPERSDGRFITTMEVTGFTEVGP